MKIKIILTIVLFFTLRIISYGQNKSSAKVRATEYYIEWQKPLSQKISNGELKKFLAFKGAQYKVDDDLLPSFSEQVALLNQQSFSVEIINATYEALSDEELALIKTPKKIGSEIKINSDIIYVKKQPRGVVNFIPLRKNNTTGKFEKLVSFDLSIIKNGFQKSSTRSVHTYAPHSVLQSGNWYKVAVPNDGIYKITPQLLQSLGMDVSTLDPQNIRVYGNGGGMLPELNSKPRLDDLTENAILFQGNTDAVLDPSEFFLFYAKGPNTWTYNSAGCPKFKHTLNLYADSSYYFITSDLGTGKRVQTQASSSATVTHTVTTFDDFAFHENDDLNFIKSGRQWFGEYFDNIASYNFSFSFPNIDLSSSATIKANIASKYSSSSSYTVNGNAVPAIGAATGDTYAITGNTCFSTIPTNPLVTVNVTKQTSDALGWLDYVEVNARRQLIMNGNQMIFRDAQSVGSGNVAQYNLTSSSPIQIWDITDPTNALYQAFQLNGNSYQFVLPADTLKQFVAFSGTSFNTPSVIGHLENQDLHGMIGKNLTIVTHPNFLTEAQTLANYHENIDLISTNVVTIKQIYNEFSSGAPDATAVRDFVKMFYDKAADSTELPKYLLLFGDGSYDNKNRFSNNTNYIPTYESVESQSLTASYVSDDFFGCLDDNEGNMIDGIDAVDVGIGRFPVKSRAEAQTAIDKIFNYKRVGVPPTLSSAANSCSSQTTGSPFGDWRNTVCFIGDDEDGNLHTSQADQLSAMVDTGYNDFNVDKIYFDAYTQVATPGGDRYPGASDAITKRVEKGCLIMNYTGHGGEVGLAHERVVEVSQINSWKNINNMPFWVTATCELSRFDDPQRTSAGEYIFLSPTGAGIGLLTTVREAFASPNFVINGNFYRSVLNPINGRMPRLGDVYEYVKTKANGNGNNSYGRNFTLLGDPALTLNYPKWDVSTDTINGQPVATSGTQTIKALSRVTVSGFVRDKNNVILTSYNGVIYPTVFDKAQTITTLSNDGALSPPFPFKLQKNVLFKGKVSVTNGYYKFTFVVPKDIAYQYGIGRISYYAENGNEDANGYYEKFNIGGSDSLAASDLVGPEVKLYMNDAKFVFGGMTNENPDLFSILKDENGINTVGNGIGHDVTAVLDGNTTNSIVLNDYYQSDLNSYKSGSIRYPFNSLGEGKHSLKLKVWDVYNNSSETYTEFIVSKSADLALSHVLNYPNPFTTRTQFYFEQNQCCQTLDVQILVFTISGKLVKTIDQFVNTEGFRSDPIEWDGRDDFGDKIGRGVYIYRVKVKTSEGSTAEKYEKLVILN